LYNEAKGMKVCTCLVKCGKECCQRRKNIYVKGKVMTVTDIESESLEHETYSDERKWKL
jgi:hypothetical protein